MKIQSAELFDRSILSSRAAGTKCGYYTTGEGSPCGSRFPFSLWQRKTASKNYPCEKLRLADGSKEEIPQALFSSPRSVRDFGMTVTGGYSRGIFGVKSAREKLWKVTNFSKKVVFGIKKRGKFGFKIWFLLKILRFFWNFRVFLRISAKILRFFFKIRVFAVF